MLTSCPSCLQGLSRYNDDADMKSDYVVVEMAKHLLGANWMENYVQKANAGGIERAFCRFHSGFGAKCRNSVKYFLHFVSCERLRCIHG